MSRNLCIYGLKSALIVVLLQLTVHASAQFSVSGRILNQKDSLPVTGAWVTISETDLWGITNDSGFFLIEKVPTAKVVLQVKSLNYATTEFSIQPANNIVDTVFYIKEDNLSLDEVTVTAKVKKEIGTSFIIERNALDHMQMLSVTDAAALLPGGKTSTALNLTSGPQNFIVNGGLPAERGNAKFGVGVEVDGVRLSANALPGVTPVDVRNIASSNVESIEIITGVPSVEYGDMTNGLVKINTRKGKSPYIIDLVTKPNTKQLAISKGFDLGRDNGILNISGEYTKSVSNLASPYTSYERNSVSLNYSNTFLRKQKKPLFLNIGLTGNVGGSDSKSDPDKFVNTYSKAKDNVIRANISGRWLLNKKWLTNIEAGSSVNFNNQSSEISNSRSSSSSVAAIHAMQTGYFVGQTYEQNPDAEILLVAPGYFYQISYNDTRAINYSANLKANWSKKVGNFSNNLLLGSEYTSSRNNGRGSYYDDIRYAPTWRPYEYRAEPALNNYTLYAEDRARVSFGTSFLQLVGGIRSEFTSVKGSEYGTVTSTSPRMNIRYTLWEKKQQAVSNLVFWTAWGKSVKLPSFNILYRTPQYRDILTFAPGTTAQGGTFYAYYSTPYTRIFNPDLQWQYNIQKELGTEFTLWGTVINIAASEIKTKSPYDGINVFEPFRYKFTDQSNLENSAIPIANRQYSVDRSSGVVSVIDKTGTLPTEMLTYREYTRLNGSSKAFNGSDVVRRSIRWIIDFQPIKSLRTSFRIDGNYYSYKAIDDIYKGVTSSSTMANGDFYRYIGFYQGGAVSANGENTRRLDMNLTAITRIPAIRLVVSARIEASLYQYSQNLSEVAGTQRGFALDNINSNVPSSIQTSIYGGDRFVGLYPDYYVDLNDMNKKIPFMESFLHAKENDPALYNELSKLVVRSNTNYYFNPNKVSAYYSANISVTKEIRDFASITFNAINFLNNMSTVHNSWSGNTATLFDSGYVPGFYYGLSLRVKF